MEIGGVGLLKMRRDVVCKGKEKEGEDDDSVIVDARSLLLNQVAILSFEDRLIGFSFRLLLDRVQSNFVVVQCHHQEQQLFFVFLAHRQFGKQDEKMPHYCKLLLQLLCDFQFIFCACT